MKRERGTDRAPSLCSRREFALGVGTIALVGMPPAACAQSTGAVPAARFGIEPHGDPARNAAGMRDALTFLREAGGGELVFGPGRYRFALEIGWVLPSGVGIRGAGKSRTTLERIDAFGANWFTSLNSAGRNRFEGFTAVGNGRSFVNGDGAFLFASIDEDARQTMADVAFRDVELRNFKGDGWIFFLMGASDHDMRGIRVDGSCSFVSLPGNSRGPADIGIWSSAMIFQGLSVPGRRGRLRDVVVGPVQADIPHIKNLCVLWGGVEGARIERPSIRRCGTIGIAPGCGAYALMVGNETEGAPNPTEIDIIGPTIDACQSVGVYLVSWGSNGGNVRFDGAGGYIANVTDRVNGTLPKGAITSTDGATNVSIRNLRAINCIAAVDIAVAAGARLSIDGVDADGITEGGSGVWIRHHVASGVAGADTNVTLSNIRVRSTARDVTGLRFTGAPPRTRIRIGGRIEIDVPYIGVSAYDEDGSGNVAPFAALDWNGEASIRNAAAGAIVFRNNASPIAIGANIEILRGNRSGARDHRVKLGGVRSLSLSGAIRIDDVRRGDSVAWDSLAGARAGRLSVRPGAVTFSRAEPALRAIDGSLGRLD